MKSIGPYRLDAELGHGAMGVVFRGFDPAIGRAVAIKIIRPDQSATASEKAELRLRFAREATAAGKLSHPNIVTVYQLGEEGDQQYLVLELVDGCSLEKTLSPGTSHERTGTISILSQVAAALDYAHGEGVVHRDVKPANIVLLPDGKAKITDFGVARLSSQTVTKTGFTMGTLAYMAPEQIKSARVNGKADQFSLAVIAYQMLGGRRPFTAETDPGLIFKIVTEEAQPLHELDHAFLPRTSDVLRKGMAKDPNQRYITCAEFVNYLAISLEEGRSAVTARSSSVPRSLNANQIGANGARARKRGLAIAIGSVALAATIVLVVSGAKNPVAPVARPVPAPPSPTIAQGLISRPLVSPPVAPDPTHSTGSPVPILQQSTVAPNANVYRLQLDLSEAKRKEKEADPAAASEKEKADQAAADKKQAELAVESEKERADRAAADQKQAELAAAFERERADRAAAEQKQAELAAATERQGADQAASEQKEKEETAGSEGKSLADCISGWATDRCMNDCVNNYHYTPSRCTSYFCSIDIALADFTKSCKAKLRIR